MYPKVFLTPSWAAKELRASVYINWDKHCHLWCIQDKMEQKLSSACYQPSHLWIGRETIQELHKVMSASKTKVKSWLAGQFLSRCTYLGQRRSALSLRNIVQVPQDVSVWLWIWIQVWCNKSSWKTQRRNLQNYNKV